jgi:quinol-cytochrome oxidoreductase complex cytochrome b subunit
MVGIGEFITESQIWKSIFRHPMPVDRRNRIVVMLTNFFLHLHPVSIKKQGIALSYTWCMGGVTFFLFLVETVTGVLLMFYYRPTLEWAYNDILALRDVYSLGIMREIHRWGAHAMVITVWLHMYRVFLTGSYKPPREFNWVVGVVLLFLTIMLSFTGYLLPWDQIAFWAITIGTNMGGYAPVLNFPVSRILLGGLEVGQNTLLRFYVGHVVFLPLIAAVFLAVHFWRIRKDGGISGPL